jgi:hypothetical protein
VAYHANVVPVKDNKNKCMWNASVSANSPNCARNWPMCSRVLFPCEREIGLHLFLILVVELPNTNNWTN